MLNEEFEQKNIHPWVAGWLLWCCGKIETLPQPRRLNCPILPLFSGRTLGVILTALITATSPPRAAGAHSCMGRDYNQQLCAAHMLVTIVPSLPLHRVGGLPIILTFLFFSSFYLESSRSTEGNCG